MPRLWPTHGLWRHSDFLKLWSAETISQFGTQVGGLALGLVAIIVLDASAFEVAALGTIQFLPFILFTLPAGVWVDRLLRRPILVTADVGRFMLLATIPVAYVADVLTLWQLYAVAFLGGICTVFFDVAYQSYLPSLVGRTHIVEGNSKLELSRSAAQISGPGAGGGLVELITAPYTVLLDAISFLVSALFLVRIAKREELDRESERAQRQSLLTELEEGLRFVLGNPYLRAQAGCTATGNFFFSLGFSIYLVYAVRTLDLSPGVIGLVLSIGSASSILAALTARRLSSRFGVGPTTVAASFVEGPGMALVPLAPTGAPIPFLVASQLVISFAIVVYNITQLSYRQALCPERLQGRMNSVMRFIVWGTIPLGTLSGGALATWVGLRETLVVASIGVGSAFLWIVVSPMRSVREMPTEPIDITVEPAGA